MSDQNQPKRRPGRPRATHADPLRTTTIRLPESLIAGIDATLGDVRGEDSRNRWLTKAARAYLQRDQDAADADGWRELRDFVQEERKIARQREHQYEAAVAAVEQEEEALAPVHATLTTEQRAYVEVVTRLEGLRGDHGRWFTVGAKLIAILTKMALLDQGSDAAVHPADWQGD